GGGCCLGMGVCVACLEFHSTMNTMGGDIISTLFESLEEVNAHFAGLVIANEGRNFSAGANLMLLLMEAVEGNWDEIDYMVRTFQRATQAIRYNPKPIVTAPFALTLGGGCEIAMAAARAQAAAGYRPPVPTEIPDFGESLGAELKLGIYLMQRAGHITEHEANIARRLAYVMCGGSVTRPSTAPEQYFLDLEREAFKSLCGERK